MAYLKAVLAAVAVALLIGAGTGVRDALTAALARLPPEDGAAVLATAISSAVNCAAFAVLIFLPAAVLLVFIVRRRRSRERIRLAQGDRE